MLGDRRGGGGGGRWILEGSGGGWGPGFPPCEVDKRLGIVDRFFFKKNKKLEEFSKHMYLLFVVLSFFPAQ